MCGSACTIVQQCQKDCKNAESKMFTSLTFQDNVSQSKGNQNMSSKHLQNNFY